MKEQLDVIIIGAGLSGIGAACHLTRECPNKRYVILEGRDAMGGTWDLFRYPGIRSDSDMYTLGYQFKPWTNPKSIADGPSILQYIKDTAREYGVNDHIQFNSKVVKAAWSTDDACWTVTVENPKSGKTKLYQAQFVLCCAGYYSYESGYDPEFPGRDQFKGDIIHPQKWPEGYDYSGKEVVVIGSGATAVTLIPSMANKAKHITMLQRSPSYVATLPEKDEMPEKLRKVLPEKWVYRLTRTRNIAFNMAFYNFCQNFPEVSKKLLIEQVKRQVGSKVDIKHFTPKYNPWDERLCAVPDGDLFKVIRKGKASVVTDQIETFTENGIQLKSGKHLDADLIITATGLNIQIMGGLSLEVDGAPFEISNKLYYKGLMLEDLPNFGMVIGYTNSSWTLKADMISQFVVRLLKHMDRKGLRQCTPRNHDQSMEVVPFLNLRSGYIQRAKDLVPRQGSKMPWKLYQNFVLDNVLIRLAKLEDGNLEFSNPKPSGKVHYKQQSA